MKQQDENVQFEAMPDWGGMFSPKEEQKPIEEGKEYSTLYEELVDKCDPAKFQEDDILFQKSNTLFGLITNATEKDEKSLTPLRNRAIQDLNIHISTKRKYDYLKKYFSIEQYTEMRPYDENRTTQAREYSKRLEQNKNDILALEQLESDAKDFINRRKEEIMGGEEPPPTGNIGITVVLLSLIVLLIFIVLKINRII